MEPSTKPPVPPFSLETAKIKVKAAQNLWNTKYQDSFYQVWHFMDINIDRNPSLVKNGYTTDSIWRNRDTFLQGHDEIVEFLTKKWSRENGYRLRKELFSFSDNKVSPSGSS